MQIAVHTMSWLLKSLWCFFGIEIYSWRPKWKYYHWSAALVGFVFCAALQFVIVWYWAIGAIILLIFIYAYIDFRQVHFPSSNTIDLPKRLVPCT